MEAKIYWKWVIRTIPELFLGLLMWASQVTPEQASSNIASWLLFFGIHEPPAWAANRAIDKWVFWGGLVCAISWAVFLWVRSRKSKNSAAELLYGKKSWVTKLRDWRSRHDEPPWVMPRGYTSMKEAAKKFYEAARAGKIAGAEASEQLSGWSNGPSTGSLEDILHWWAVHIAKELPVYGRRPPSSLLEKIHERQIKDFIFADKATRLKDPMNDSVYYTDLAVKSDSLDAQYNFEAGYHG